MHPLLDTSDARSVQTRFVDSRDRRLAYRRLGSGPPLVLCLRLRGVLDDWDPAFLDSLAEHFTVITFDYSGLGQSTGRATYAHASLARDALDLIDALGYDEALIGGWSLGGLAAQVFAASYPERTRALIVLGSGPPGPQPHAPDPRFLETALHPVHDLDDELLLFFEPDDPASREAAARSHARIASRTGDKSPAIRPSVYERMLAEVVDPDAVFPDPDGLYAGVLRQASFPILAINGDHDIEFPVENWYALNPTWQSLHVFTIPRAGHGPQHQCPELCAAVIAAFGQQTIEAQSGRSTCPSAWRANRPSWP